MTFDKASFLSWGIIALIIVKGGSAAAQDDRPPTFYQLQSDQSSVQLLDLASIDGTGVKTTADTIDLFRSPSNFGLRSTWQIDCIHRRMTITRAARLSPDGEEPAITVSPEYRTPTSSAARTMFGLACAGAGDLVASRTSYDDLATIIARFWR